MPDPHTVRTWVLENRDGISPRYAHARELQAEYWADEILEISDDGTNDWVERKNPNGTTYMAIDHEHVARSKLRSDNRKWLLSKLRPGTYGDKVQHANAAGDGDMTVKVKEGMSLREMKAAAAALVASKKGD